MSKQFQHIVPQVYLKGFGFQKPEYGNKWFVSVKDINQDYWHDREIKKFLGENDLYDLTLNHQNIPNKIIENKLHNPIENRFPKIVEYLDSSTFIHREMHKDIAETTANFLCRSKLVLDWIENILNNKAREFWHIISDKNGIFETEEHREMQYCELMKQPIKDRTINFMLFFMLHVKLILNNARLTVFKYFHDYILFTNDCPVQIKNVGFGEIVKPEFELYFALTKNYLIYFYWDSKSCELTSIQPLLINDKIQPMNQELYKYFCNQIILLMVNKYIIAPTNRSFLGH